MTEILNYIQIYSPVIVAVLGEVAVVIVALNKVASYFKGANETVKGLEESIEYKKLRDKIDLVVQENIDLKKKIDKYLELELKIKAEKDEKSNH